MARPKKRINDLKSETNSGYSNISNSTGGRFINRDGKPNVIKRGLSVLSRYSWYHTMLGMSRGHFLGLLFLIYICVNLVFAGVYYLIGAEHLAGIEHNNSWKEFSEVFFFSTQTF